MISESIIDSARQIKNEFERLNQILSNYEDDIRNLADYFFKISDDLGIISDEASKKKSSIQSIQKSVVDKLTNLEEETNKVGNKIQEVNNKIEKLKQEELELYKLIKRRYPSLTDEEIKIEIQRRL